MNTVPVQKRMDRLLNELKLNNIRPALLLHVCCAPCSSYVLEYLSEYFDITVFFYNPNITPKEEYDHRVRELMRLVSEMGLSEKVRIVEGEYEPELFFARTKGLEQEPEGGARCEECFHLRLQKACEYAAAHDYDYVTTTLTISPLKNADLLNCVGNEEGKKAGVTYLDSDFKKKNGYKRSIELSAIHNLYRQNYCGCIFSKRDN